MKLNQEEEDKARGDFLIGLLFHIHEMFPGAPSMGATKRGADGLYEEEHIEACWRGFLMAKQQDRGQLERFDHKRYISTGMLTRLKGSLGREHDDETLKDMIRCVLIIVGDSPS